MTTNLLTNLIKARKELKELKKELLVETNKEEIQEIKESIVEANMYCFSLENKIKEMAKNKIYTNVYRKILNTKYSSIAVYTDSLKKSPCNRVNYLKNDISIKNWDESKGIMTYENKNDYELITLNYHDGSKTLYLLETALPF